MEHCCIGVTGWDSPSESTLSCSVTESNNCRNSESDKIPDIFERKIREIELRRSELTWEYSRVPTEYCFWPSASWGNCFCPGASWTLSRTLRSNGGRSAMDIGVATAGFGGGLGSLFGTNMTCSASFPERSDSPTIKGTPFANLTNNQAYVVWTALWRDRERKTRGISDRSMLIIIDGANPSTLTSVILVIFSEFWNDKFIARITNGESCSELENLEFSHILPQERTPSNSFFWRGGGSVPKL